MIGTSVDRYKIVEELGHGGMSVVYRGVDSSLERDVAVKVLHNHLAKRAESRQRFHREAKAIARLKHPNILSIYDYSSADAEQSYIVMEYIEGVNLREFLGQHSKAAPEASALVGLALARALQCAHQHGIIHRDLKPENVMVSKHGELKLMDFGIAHVIDAETMTQTGSLLGSPAHMAPEMIEGEKADERADIFALGTVLYWLVSGTLPYDGANTPQVLKKVLAGEHERISDREPKTGAQLAAIIERCMAHEPENRYSKIDEVIRVLTGFLEESGIDDPDTELRRYLKSPEKWTEEFIPLLMPRLLTLGKGAIENSDFLKALGYLNRILAYEPDNEEVQRLIERISRRFSARGTMIALALLVFATLTVGLIVMWINSTPSPKPTSTEVVVSTPSEPKTVEPELIEPAEDVLADTAEIASRYANEVAEHAITITSTPQPVTVRPIVEPVVLTQNPTVIEEPPEEVEEVEKTFLYQFRVSPPAAELSVLGRTFSSIEAARGIELPAGKHLVSVNSRGCKGFREVYDVSGPQRGREDIVLEWEDGVVNVSADVDAVIFLGDDTRNVSRKVLARKSTTFRFPFGNADQDNLQRVAFHIAPASDMTRRKTYSVTLRPGTTETLNVAFGQNR